MLTIRVGTETNKQEFVAHESFLTSRSEFFRRAMNGRWAEAESRVVMLPADEPQYFALYLNFVYTGQLNTMGKSKEELATLELSEAMKHIKQEYQDLFRLYILAEKLQDVAAKNAALTAAISVTELKSAGGNWDIPTLEVVNSVYKCTLEGSPARRLLTDMYSTLPPIKLLRLSRRTFPHEEFISDLAIALRTTCPLKEGVPGNVALKNGAQAYLEEV